MSQYSFGRLIDKYAATFTVTKGTEGYYDDDTGEYVPGSLEETPMHGMIAPLKATQIYGSGGRLTASDRELYSFEPLEYKTIIQYKGTSYSVEEAEDYSDFADFYYYSLKAVNAFNAETQ